MAARGGIHFVRYYFYAGNTIDPVIKEKLVGLAYATARDKTLAPTAILIRYVRFDLPLPSLLPILLSSLVLFS